MDSLIAAVLDSTSFGSPLYLEKLHIIIFFPKCSNCSEY